MSVCKDIEISCKKCGAKKIFKVWQSVNVSEDKTFRDRVINRDIFKFKCDSCGVESFIEYPFVYHDFERKFFIYFDNSGKFENLIETEGYRTRTASNYFELIEIICILENDINEDMLRNKKTEILNKFGNNEKLKHINKIYYSGVKDDKMEFFVPEINGKIIF